MKNERSKSVLSIPCTKNLFFLAKFKCFHVFLFAWIYTHDTNYSRRGNNVPFQTAKNDLRAKVVGEQQLTQISLCERGKVFSDCHHSDIWTFKDQGEVENKMHQHTSDFVFREITITELCVLSIYKHLFILMPWNKYFNHLVY